MTRSCYTQRCGYQWQRFDPSLSCRNSRPYTHTATPLFTISISSPSVSLFSSWTSTHFRKGNCLRALLFRMELFLFVSLVGLVYIIYGVIYRLYLSPIAHIPGPKIAALTGLYAFLSFTRFHLTIQGTRHIMTSILGGNTLSRSSSCIRNMGPLLGSPLGNCTYRIPTSSTHSTLRLPPVVGETNTTGSQSHSAWTRAYLELRSMTYTRSGGEPWASTLAWLV